MFAGLSSWVLTVLVFGAVGWLVASRRRKPAGVPLFLGVIVVGALGFYVGRDTIVIGVDHFRIFLNWIIVSVCAGGALGLLVRNLDEWRRPHA